jgi:hypothetical protein
MQAAALVVLALVMYVESEMVQMNMRVSPMIVAAAGITYYFLKDQEVQKKVPTILRTVVHAQDIGLLQQRGQPWYEKFQEVETDDVISYVGRRRLWQFKSL